MPEIWLPVVGFSNYLVSSSGRLKRVGGANTRWGKGRLLGSKSKSTGYVIASVYQDGNKKQCGIHVFVCEAFHGPKPTDKHEVAHGDGVKDNNKAKNLRWATRSENALDKHKHGTMPLGDKHHSRIKPECLARGEKNGGGGKLTEKQVRKIKADQRLHRVIAADYGVVKSMVSMIKRGENWKHVI